MLQNHSASRLFLTRAAATFLFAALAGVSSFAQSAKRPEPQKSSRPNLSVLDSIVKAAVADDEIPGGVLLVSHRGHVIYRKAIGERALIPHRERMTVGTIFDLASLTKLFATTPSIMRLLEQGKIRLNDPLSRYMPEFASHGKDQITIR
ncbi:MAG: serine hydrolase domain-containing protein, partial [Candidatus Acidiferrales bacterium]